MHLKITLPSNRIHSGFFTLVDGCGTLLLAGRARGKADNGAAKRHNNPTRDPKLPFGDAPLGEYVRARVVLTSNQRLGESWIPIMGKSGDALKAVDNGRTGIGIHAGRKDTDGKLVATHGCVRLSERDYEQLVYIVGDEYFDVTIQGED